MDVDPFALEVAYSGEVSRLPLIDESSTVGLQAPKDKFPKDELIREKWVRVVRTQRRDDEWMPTAYSTICSKHFVDTDKLISVLDQVEMRVERLRRDTVRIVEERDSLLSTLDSVKHSELLSDISECDKDDIQRYAERILARAMTVEVAVRTDRDPSQEEALHQVNMYIDQLVMSVQEDGCTAHARCLTYMNACTSQPDPNTGTDKNFETAILGCTLDDQKRVKKRLQGLLDYFAKLNVTSCT